MSISSDESPVKAQVLDQRGDVASDPPTPVWIGSISLVIGRLIAVARPTSACSCAPPLPACALVTGSDLVFLGKGVYSNDDGSGTFNQYTLIRFEVEEAFKGQGPNAREVWIDPGSFGSCYANYEVGKDYLVFASKGWSLAQSVAMNSGKPLPPGLFHLLL